MPRVIDTGIAVGIIAVVLALYGAVMLRGGDGGADLAPLLIAARLFADGRADALYAYDPGFLDIFDNATWVAAAEAAGYKPAFYYGYLYPPLWAALLSPLACRTDFATFYWIVAPLNVAALGGAMLVAAVQWNPKFLRPLPLLLGLVAVCASWPAFLTLGLAQVQPVVILLVVIAMAASQRGTPALAGVTLALAAAIKLVPLVIALYWLCTRRASCALWFAAIGGGLAVMSVALAGWSSHEAFIAALMRAGAGYPAVRENQSIIAWLGEIGSPGTKGFTVPIKPMPAWVSAAVLIGAGVLMSAVVRLAKPYKDDDALAMAALFLIATLASPMAWTHYLIFLVVPLIILSKTRPMIGVALVVAAVLSFPAALYSIRLVEQGSGLRLWNGMAASLLVLGAIMLHLRRSDGTNRALGV
jgi:hypothetical protein